MKYIIIIPDGAADEPQASLGGKTPLAAAHTPAMDAIAAAGVVGRANNVNFVGSEVSEKNLSGSSVPTWVYLAAVPCVLWAAVYFTGVIRRRVRKLRLANAPAQPGWEKKRKGKRRR